ncbi:MAG TPA: YbaB/EbfC family nucleoid-associated protein [bacterium]|nr:YbaB/EbfC family nucleoid-associated protein [bacterium]
MNLGDVKEMFKMRSEMKKIQDAISKLEAEGNSAGGMVKVRASGDQRITGVTVDPKFFELKDTRKAEDYIKTAANIALDGAKRIAQGEMKKMTGINLPGF